MRKEYIGDQTKKNKNASPRSNTGSEDNKADLKPVSRLMRSLLFVFACIGFVAAAGVMIAYLTGAFSVPPSTVDAPPTDATSVITMVDPSAPRTGTLPLDGKIVILDAGHGGYDNGCAYPKEDPTYKEKDFNLKIAYEAKKILEDLGAEVIMTRTDDSFISIYARPAMVHLLCLDYAKENGLSSVPERVEARLRAGMDEAIRINSTDISAGCMGAMVGSGFSDDMIALLEFEYTIDEIIFISVHNNWNSDTTLHGTQVYYVTDDSIIESEDRLIRNDPYYSDPDYIVRDHYYGRDGEKNRLLARLLHDSITQASPELEPNVPELVTDNFAVLREHGLASVMLELTFVSCPEDRDLLSDERIIRNMAVGIADGCLNYFHNMDP
ncbi:MAG: N-acetylmuramoyl-L-alanine amidase [Clostridiales bacterium]|nr:N-acetylmuramoyl-L-alanine amidase [Clostridiales bacterium]